jgi:biopolymer transport protein ExbD
MAKKGRDRVSMEINAGSMADIAFLLLIFFLVTTQIVEDKGILVQLPPWEDTEPEPLKLESRNIYGVLVNADNQLLVRGELMDIKNLKENTKLFIANPRNDSDKAESPKKAVISLKNDRGTKYKTYISVYNELQAAYAELRNDFSLKKYGLPYEQITDAQKREVRTEIPLVISEAELTSFGDEN